VTGNIANFVHSASESDELMATKKVERSKKGRTPATVEEEKKSFSLARIKEFVSEVKAEFNKIVWPDKKVTIGSTGVVIVLVFIVSIYLGAVDLLIGRLVSYILK
jgi:preprotein translocase subunit SecE